LFASGFVRWICVAGIFARAHEAVSGAVVGDGIIGLPCGFHRILSARNGGVDTSVLTLFGNVILGPRFGFVRPFVLGGVGLIKSHVELNTGSLLDSSNNFGWDFGGGLMFMFGDHVGVRGDLRRFQSFQDQSILGFSLAEEKLKFNRATAGLVLGF